MLRAVQQRRNPTKSVDRTLLRNIANALSWLDRIKAGKTYEQIATEDAIPTDRVRKAIRYAFLAPDIVRAIVEGRQPVGLTSSYLLHHPVPSINSSCMRLANFLQPGCFGRLHIGRFNPNRKKKRGM